MLLAQRLGKFKNESAKNAKRLKLKTTIPLDQTSADYEAKQEKDEA